MKAQAGSFTLSGSAGNQTVTVTGFGEAPKALILWTIGTASEGATTTFVNMLGFATSSTARCAMSVNSENGAATSDTDRRIDNTKVFCRVISGGTVSLASDFVSFGSSGGDGQFTIDNITVDGVGTRIAYYLVLGGSDFSAAVITGTANTTTGTKTYAHGLGVTPTAVMQFSVTTAGTLPNQATTNSCTIGLSDGTTSRQIAFTSEEAVADSNTKRSATANFYRSHASDTGTANQSCVVSALDSTNVTLNFDVSDGGARNIAMLVMAGISAKVGTFSTPTATGSQSVTGVGFTPVGAMFLSACKATAAGTQDTAAYLFGADDGTNSVSSGGLDTDAQATMDADRWCGNSKSLRIYDTTPTLKLEGDISSLDSDGFSLSYPTYDAGVSYEVAYLALGTTPAASSYIVGGGVATASGVI